MSEPLKILLVEDSDDDEKLILRELRRSGRKIECERVQSAPAMRAALGRRDWDVIISDWSVPSFGASAALELLKAAELDIPFIITSGTVDDDASVEALRAGAHDFVLKSKLARLAPAIEREMRERTVRASRRRAEEQLRASEARYRALFDCSPLPMLVFDRDTLAFLTVNDVAIEHYGYSREEFARMTLADLRPLEDVQEPTSVPGSPVDAARWRHRRKDGSVIVVDVKAHDFELDGRRARLAVCNDISDRLRAEEMLRQTEEQLRHSQKMEAVGRLAGGVAHDFNNVLSVILSYSEILVEELKPGDPLRADIEEIRNAGRRAADLTRQLLMFSRQQVLEPKVLDVNQSLIGMERMLKRLLGEDIELSLLTFRPSGKIHVDPSQLEQVVMNLVVNARDAMPEGGQVTIETDAVELDAEYVAQHHGVAAGSYVLIAVTDTGAGMDAATEARIFEPYFTTKEKGKGTGLGLSTVFGIVQQSGGHVRVRSELGAGTTFKVYLPLTDQPTAMAPLPLAPVTLRGSETILLVEDEEQVRHIVRTVLRRHGYNVLEAQNGGEAFLICEKYPTKIDLLATDVIMPRMSGRDLVARLAPMRGEMKVLFMSGYTDNTVIHEAGAAFLQKPITPDAILRKVREVLDAPKGKPSAARA